MGDKALFVMNSLSGGGAEKICLNLAAELVKSMDVDIVSIYDEAALPTHSGIRHISLGVQKNRSKFLKLFQLIKCKGAFERFVRSAEKDGPYSLITSHLTASHALVGLSCIKNRCLYVHHSLPLVVSNSYSRIFAPIFRYLYSGKKMVGVSHGVRRQLLENYEISDSDVATIYNPVSFYEVKNGIREKTVFNRPYILFVGRLVPIKRLDRMLDIYLRGNFCSQFDLLFLGEGPLKGEIKRKAFARGHAHHVHFLGYKKNPYSWMHNSSAMVLTSDWEALPTVLIEGILSGAHVVSSDCDFGPREIMTGEYRKYLVEPNDIAGYIEAINNAIASYPPLSDCFVDRFDPKQVASRYIKTYQEFFY